MPHDLGTWGFILAVVTLILALPLDILAHLSTPVVRDWWARRSIAALKKRHEYLSSTLNALSNIPANEEGIDRIIEFLTDMAVIISTGLNAIIGVITVLTIILCRSMLKEIPWDIVFIATVTMVFTGLFTYWTQTKLEKYRKATSPRYRRSLSRKLDKVNEDLARRTH